MSAKRMLLKTAAASAVILLGTTTVASAHHCYKDQWADAAYQHHLAGGTAWVSLSDMGAEFLIPTTSRRPAAGLPTPRFRTSWRQRASSRSP